MRYFCCLILMLFWATDCVGQQIPIQTELAKESAWTGEKVPLIITLFSPGPFSGTPSFDLPELPRTAILKIGSPLVGSEEVNGESYITQRHEFAIYTQRSGEIVIPSFQVRYSGKNDFISESVPRESVVPELRFDSRRPPSTESMGVVVSATEMQIRQSWNPEQMVEFAAGDVVQRIITRTAEGTTAMMLPPVSATAPEGIRLHTSAPDVQDNYERGQSSAMRTETLKYQFERAGQYSLPQIEFQWWDPKQESLQQETLPGLTVQVIESENSNQQSVESQTASSQDRFTTVTRLIGGGLLAGLALLAFWSMKQYWHAYQHQPEVHAANELRKACASNNPQAAYSALLAWFDAIQHDGEVNTRETLFANDQHSKLQEQWQFLSRHLFASESTRAEWNPKHLRDAFRQSNKLLGLGDQRVLSLALPPLNPSVHELQKSQGHVGF